MLITRPPDIPSSEITDERLYITRRDFLKAAGLAGVALGELVPTSPFGFPRRFGDDDKLTPWADVTGYNNYYEFGTDKDDPARNAGQLLARPWKVEIAGEVAKPATYDLDDLLKGLPPEERVYRHRCVEALVHGRSLDGHPARPADRPPGADEQGEVRRGHHARSIRGRCRGSSAASSTGRTPRRSEWMRRAIRSRCW